MLLERMTNHPAKMSDIELYAALKLEKPSSEKAFAELYARYSPRIMTVRKMLFRRHLSSFSIVRSRKEK